MFNELLINFILGGLLFSSIFYTSNILKDPSLSAIIALAPISIIACYIIKSKNLTKQYLENSFIVIFLTGLIILFGLYLIKFTKIEKNILICLLLIIWFIIQYIRYKIKFIVRI